MQISRLSQKSSDDSLGEKYKPQIKAQLYNQKQLSLPSLTITDEHDLPETSKELFYQQEMRKKDNIVMFLCEKLQEMESVLQGKESQIDILRTQQNKSTAHNNTCIQNAMDS